MTEAATPPASAGALLRQAREARGMHIAALAAAMKVSPAKLEAIESDRYEQLPDMTFVRALAQTMCRLLKTDPQPVLALLPQAVPAGGPDGLARVSSGLNTPFRDQGDRADPWARLLSRGPLVWAGAALLVAAVVVYGVPAGHWFGREAPSAPATFAAPAAPALASAPADAASQPASAAIAQAEPAPAAAVETVFSSPIAASGADGAEGVAVLRASEPSWVEVSDAGGQLLLSRTLQPGESVGLNGALPLKFKIGNAAATELVFRGLPVPLAGTTRDNVARLELK